MPHEPKELFIVDANALIDYYDSDLQALSQFSQHIGTVHIARSTFAKVKQLTAAEAKKHHLCIITPSLEILSAASKARGPLAYDDIETLLLAKSHGWSCITNDKALRRECDAEGVSCLWGLEPMKALVKTGALKMSRALTVAKKIQAANPGFIGSEIIERFETEIRRIQAENDIET